MNELWTETMNDKAQDWKYYESKFKTLYSSTKSQFLDSLALVKDSSSDNNDHMDLVKLVNIIKDKGTSFLEEEYSILSEHHPKYKNLVELSFDKYFSPDWAARLCNGLIIDIDTDRSHHYRVVNYPCSVMIGSDDQQIFSKLDLRNIEAYKMVGESGQQISMFCYHDQWVLSSDAYSHVVLRELENQRIYQTLHKKNYYNPWKFFGGPEGRIKVKEYMLFPTALDLMSPSGVPSDRYEEFFRLNPPGDQVPVTLDYFFWKLWKEKSYQLPTEECKKYSFTFEISCPNAFKISVNDKNRKVTGDLVLISVRNLDNNEEVCISDLKKLSSKFGWDHTYSSTYDIQRTISSCKSKKVSDVYQTIEDDLKESFHPSESRGIIIVESNSSNNNNNVNRFKFHSPFYKYIKEILWQNDITQRKNLMIFLIVQQHYSVDSIQSLLPVEFHKEFNVLLDRYNYIVTNLQTTYDDLSSKFILNTKEIAQEINNREFSTELFSLARSSHKNSKILLSEMKPHRLLTLF
eukprot:TRINITY_DN4268_c0_g1_i5.p1 TRINITY_DN4268_c0_g1~~TRINITY_DN4268_c0_g1_i5.p1  ORF type:complete len:518 (-),score=117.50 TRINITY_DN4268_c0_g1_i5:46-1599(-)